LLGWFIRRYGDLSLFAPPGLQPMAAEPDSGGLVPGFTQTAGPWLVGTSLDKPGHDDFGKSCVCV
jgi:hypothetical protein